MRVVDTGMKLSYHLVSQCIHPGRMGIFEGGEKQHLTLLFSSSYLMMEIFKTERNDKKSNGESTKTRWLYWMNNWTKY